MNPNIVIDKTGGISTHGNDLSAEPGSTSVADNVTFSRERLPELRRGFRDDSTYLPDYSPQQLIVGSNGSDLYLNIDGGLWYASGTLPNASWFRKWPADAEMFQRLAGIWVDATETYAYVSDFTLHAIYRITIATGVIALFAGTISTSGTTDATGSAAKFNAPAGIWGDGTNLYVADSGNFSIRKIVIATAVVTTFAGLNGTSAHTDNATGTSARFQSPWGIWSDGTNLYVSEKDHGYIRKIVISSTATTTLTSGLTNPKGLWVSAGGSTLYVSTSNATIVRTVNTGTGTDAAFATGLTGDAGTRSLMHSDGTYLWVGQGTNRKISRVKISDASVSNSVVSIDMGAETIGVWVFSGKLWLVGRLYPVYVVYPSTGQNYPLVTVVTASGSSRSGRSTAFIQGPP